MKAFAKVTLVYLDHARASPLQQARALSNGVDGIQALDLYSVAIETSVRSGPPLMMLGEIGSRFMLPDHPPHTVPRRMQSGDVAVLDEGVFLADFNKWTQLDGELETAFRKLSGHGPGDGS